jgi:hypothetical protein
MRFTASNVPLKPAPTIATGSEEVCGDGIAGSCKRIDVLNSGTRHKAAPPSLIGSGAPDFRARLAGPGSPSAVGYVDQVSGWMVPAAKHCRIGFAVDERTSRKSQLSPGGTWLAAKLVLQHGYAATSPPTG